MSLVGAQLEMGLMTGSCPCLIGRHSGSLLLGLFGFCGKLRLGSRPSQVGGASISRNGKATQDVTEIRRLISKVLDHLELEQVQAAELMRVRHPE